MHGCMCPPQWPPVHGLATDSPEVTVEPGYEERVKR